MLDKETKKYIREVAKELLDAILQSPIDQPITTQFFSTNPPNNFIQPNFTAKDIFGDPSPKSSKEDEYVELEYQQRVQSSGCISVKYCNNCYIKYNRGPCVCALHKCSKCNGQLRRLPLDNPNQEYIDCEKE